MSINYQIAKLLQITNFADGLNTQSPRAFIDFATRYRKVHRAQLCGEFIQTQVVRRQAPGIECYFNFRRLGATDIDASNSRNTLEPTSNAHADHFVFTTQIAW